MADSTIERRCTRAVDSSQAIVASSGALQNITSYLNGTFVNLSNVFQESSEYLSETLGIPPTVIYSSLAALVAVPITMARYGWASSREQISPYSSMGGGAPAVTDDDFSYITSQDLDDPGLGLSSHHHQHRSHSAAPPGPEDDVLLIKNRGVTYPAHFPAYTIGDGKLRVKDVRDRVGLMMDLSDRATRHIKLLYKGKQLKEPAAPVRDYGVKNKSELMAMVGEVGYDGSSPSEEEMVIVGDAARDDKKSKRRRKKRGKASDRADGDSASSPRDSSSTLNPPRSPPTSKSPPVPSSGAKSGPMKDLEDLALDLNTRWLPLCDKYVKATPADAKKREEEHRKLSESLMQHIVLKADNIETDGIPEVRMKRKELVQQVQAVLKTLDIAKDS
ncbi:BAG domain-containing protein [Stachybotrys elegans]|uniref:BAG domain-containing protein n=1 Tax=Stachybotrys elegans TaxID=80388 RepID=A0A8K0WNL7_9HYPO|nr:BAG domain-containing protein [Stachybotrys elegans]